MIVCSRYPFSTNDSSLASTVPNGGGETLPSNRQPLILSNSELRVSRVRANALELLRFSLKWGLRSGASSSHLNWIDVLSAETTWQLFIYRISCFVSVNSVLSVYWNIGWLSFSTRTICNDSAEIDELSAIPPFRPQRFHILCQLGRFVIRLPGPTNNDPLNLIELWWLTWIALLPPLPGLQLQDSEELSELLYWIPSAMCLLDAKWITIMI